jgi:hypothetical protein
VHAVSNDKIMEEPKFATAGLGGACVDRCLGRAEAVRYFVNNHGAGRLFSTEER